MSNLYCTIRVSGWIALLTLSLVSDAILGRQSTNEKPSVVRVVKTASGYQLVRNGEPYFIRGGGGWDFLQELKAAGGNSIRTWGGRMDSAAIDRAHELGLTVAFGLWLGQVRHGFNYSDSKQVQEQFERIQKIVKERKNHPALLIWGIGNEMEIETPGDDPALWGAIEQIARMIKREDPNHPTMTVVAGVTQKKVDAIKKYCPILDVLGVNGYGGAASIPEQLSQFGWEKPYIVTEFGPAGAWKTMESPWGAPIEKSSTHKANAYLLRYLAAINSEKGRCLGSYVYFWGVEPKFVKTHTWYETFLPGGKERLGSADAMTLAWTGKLPSNVAPEIMFWQTDAALKEVSPESQHEAVVVARDGDGDPLHVRWEVREEMPTLSGPEPAVVEECIIESKGTRLVYRAPREEGPYRLFVYVFDGKGNAATANIPFYVKR